jgi:phage gp45-like
MGIDQQIRCLANEVKRRKKNYPKLVGKGLMTEVDASYEIQAMQAALETLTQLKGMVQRVI